MRPRLHVGTPLLAAGLAGFLAVSGSSAASPSAHAGPPCGPKTAKTLAASHTARVYSQRGIVYGCSAHGTVGYTLGRRDLCNLSIRVAPVTVTADLAAYGAESCGIDTGRTAVIVVRLTDDKQLANTPATSPPGVESFQHVDSLVLKRDGSVAWIGDGSSIVGHGRRIVEVRKLDKRGLSVLDLGAGVRTDSLRLHRSTLRWRDEAHTRTATLH
jgi:hypothetical protein